VGKKENRKRVEAKKGKERKELKRKRKVCSGEKEGKVT